ncbi:hypothetical protein EB796_023552 [Bugula neritina]|uniref:Uncharacterized protein n=1 Tax=Bugula neritina TaxID=10212 RepID=A0A7J7IW62_BUGNE|nr:hypothetical protein EB796_023552 [Bugula neritina]
MGRRKSSIPSSSSNRKIIIENIREDDLEKISSAVSCSLTYREDAFGAETTAEELRCTFECLRCCGVSLMNFRLIKGYEERGAFKPKEVNFLASEQHSLWSAANSHLANLLKFSREDEVDKEIGEQTTEEGVTGQGRLTCDVK